MSTTRAIVFVVKRRRECAANSANWQRAGHEHLVILISLVGGVWRRRRVVVIDLGPGARREQSASSRRAPRRDSYRRERVATVARRLRAKIDIERGGR